MSPLYEINVLGNGTPSEVCPMIMSGLNIQISKYELVKERTERAFGPNFNMNMLCDQVVPLSIQEIWIKPDSKNTNIIEGTNNIGSAFKEAGDSIKKTFRGALDTIRRPLKPPADSDRETWVYDGVWFTTLGRTISASDTRIINTEASLTYTRLYRVS
jgi:hypothetical protein